MVSHSKWTVWLLRTIKSNLWIYPLQYVLYYNLYRCFLTWDFIGHFMILQFFICFIQEIELNFWPVTQMNWKRLLKKRIKSLKMVNTYSANHLWLVLSTKWQQFALTEFHVSHFFYSSVLILNISSYSMCITIVGYKFEKLMRPSKTNESATTCRGTHL